MIECAHTFRTTLAVKFAANVAGAWRPVRSGKAM
jgi:hypothetical protein